MRTVALGFFGAIALAGCAPPEPPMPGGLAGECSTGGLGSLVGKRATADVLAQARRKSGATAVRVLRPGQVVTMEYRNGRLNANVDVRNVIKSFSCG